MKQDFSWKRPPWWELSEEHQKQICRFLKDEWKPMTADEIKFLKGYLKWKAENLRRDPPAKPCAPDKAPGSPTSKQAENRRTGRLRLV